MVYDGKQVKEYEIESPRRKSMWTKLVDTGILVTILLVLKYTLFDKLTVYVKDGSYVTAIICCTIVFCAVVIPFILRGK